MSLDGLQRALEEGIVQAKRGAEFWQALKKDTQLAADECVVLFPEKDDCLNETALIYLAQFLDFRQYRSALVLAADEKLAISARQFCGRVRQALAICPADADALLRYYALLEFSNRFIVVSLDKPEARLGELLPAYWDFPLHEVVCAGIYRMYNYTPLAKAPQAGTGGAP